LRRVNFTFRPSRFLLEDGSPVRFQPKIIEAQLGAGAALEALGFARVAVLPPVFRSRRKIRVRGIDALIKDRTKPTSISWRAGQTYEIAPTD